MHENPTVCFAWDMCGMIKNIFFEDPQIAQIVIFVHLGGGCNPMGE